MKKYFSKLTLAIVLALVMGLAFAAPAMADDPPPYLTGDALLLSITKELRMDFGTAIPDAVFEFMFTQVEPRTTVSVEPGYVEGWTFERVVPPVITIDNRTIAYPADLINPQPAPPTQPVDPGYLAQLAPGNLVNLGSVNWPHAGNFFFVIQELPNTNQAIYESSWEGMIYCDNAWLLIVTVGNFVTGTPPTEQLRVSGIQVAELGTDNAPVYTPGQPGEPGTWTPGDRWWNALEKEYNYGPGTWTPPTDDQPGEWVADPSSIRFVNRYAYNDGPSNDRPVNDTPVNDRPVNDRPVNDQGQYARLYIGKTVVENRQHADLTTDFAFNATLTLGPITVANFNNETITLPLNIVGFVQEQNAAGEWVDLADLTPPISPADPYIVVFTRNLTGAVPNVTAITYTGPDFELRDGQRLRFAANVPSGTTIEVTERALENWEVDSVYFNDPDPREITTTTNAAGDTIANSGTLVPPGVVTTAGGESMQFNNNYLWSPIMGLVIGSMPFMAALLGATVLLAMMVASRSRQRIEQLPIAY